MGDFGEVSDKSPVGTTSTDFFKKLQNLGGLSIFGQITNNVAIKCLPLSPAPDSNAFQKKIF